MMLQKPKSRKTAILKYGLSAPLFLIAMVLSSATISENKTIKQIENQIQPAQPIAEILVPKAVENLVVDDKKEEVVFEKPVINGSKDGEFDAFKKHIQRTLKYPVNAKSSGTVGKVGFDFIVNATGIITSVKAINSQNEDLTQEGIRTISLFSEKLDVEAGNYSIVLNFTLIGEAETKSDKATSFGVLKNYIGEIVVNGYFPTNLMVSEVKVNGSNTDNDEPIFSNVEVLPSFPGGVEGFRKFLAENLKYPATAKANKIQGRVFATFVVEKDGALSNIRIVRGMGSGCDEEAVRVLSISPKWTPAIQNGRMVRVQYTIPIFFQLDNNPAPPPAPIEISSMNKALFVIDGVEYKGDKDKLKLELEKAGSIETINVLNSEKAIEKYGEKGKDGVIEINTYKKK